MYASIAGLKAHMQKLSVIGNNVANVNTYGYKTQRIVFRDAVYNVYSGGSNGTAVVGGKNPSEIGYGSTIGSIDMDMSSSTLTPGNTMDCAIVGDGFFLVGNKEVAGVIDPLNPESFKSLNLTRVGDFSWCPSACPAGRRSIWMPTGTKWRSPMGWTHRLRVIMLLFPIGFVILLPMRLTKRMRQAAAEGPEETAMAV